MFRHLGQLATDRPKTILVIAAVLTALAALLAIHAPAKLQSEGFASPNAPSMLAADRLTAHLGGQPNLVLLVTARHDTVGTPAVAAAGRQLTARLAASAGVTGVSSYWTSGDPALRSRSGSQALVLGTVEGSDPAVTARTKTLVAELSTRAGAHGPVTVRVGGGPAADAAVTQQINTGLARAEEIAIPVTLALLILAFGTVIAALLPVAIGLLAIVATLAVLDVLASLTAVSVYALDLTTALSLGLGIDYSLLMVNRYREELAAGACPASAVSRSIATAGRTIVCSAGAVAAALATLLVFPMYFLRSFAYAGISVIIVAVAAALLVLPALLTVLGPRVDAWPVRKSSRLRRAESPFWRRAAAVVTRRPVLTALPVVLVLVALGTPFLHVRWGIPDDRVLPASAAARQVGDALRCDFSVDADNTLDIVTEPALPRPAAATYSRQLSLLPGIDQVTGPAGTWAHGIQVPDPPAGRFSSPGASFLAASITPDPLSGAAQSLVRQVRAVPAPDKVSAEVGGTAADLVDEQHDLGSRLPLALALMALTTFAVLFAFTGSLVLPVKALALNTLSLTAVFGAIVWVFQDGHLAGLLGFTPTPTNMTMPLLLFCIAFGLSMDYEVFVLSRIKELHDAGLPNTAAVIGGLARTGRIVTTAAAVLAVTFVAIGLSKISMIQMFGLGTALAIVLDATLIRGVIVPAFMRLAGNANWWAPAPLRRLHRRIGLAGQDPATARTPRPEPDRRPRAASGPA